MADDRRIGFLEWIGVTNDPNYGDYPVIGFILRLFLIFCAVLSAVLFFASFFVAFHSIYKTLWPDPIVIGAPSPGGGLGIAPLIVALLGAPFLIWQTWLKTRDLNFKKEGHITDRINKAVEMLGAEKTVKRPVLDDDGQQKYGTDGKPIIIETTVPNIEVRLGAILSLERIAQDSTAYDKGRDHIRVMEILCAYIRQNAPASGALIFDEWIAINGNLMDFRTHSSKIKISEKWRASLNLPRQDVQLALTVIGRRTTQQILVEIKSGNHLNDEIFLGEDFNIIVFPNEFNSSVNQKNFEVIETIKYNGYRIDLRATNLQNMDISGLNFRFAQFGSSYLDGSYFAGSRLEGASFSNASIVFANFVESRMSFSILLGTKLKYSNLCRTKFHACWIYDVDLNGCYTENTCFDYAILDNIKGNNGKNESYYIDEIWYKSCSFIKTKFRNIQFNSPFVRTVNLRDSFGDASVVFSDIGLAPSHWPKFILKVQAYGDSIVDLYELEYQRWLASPATYVPPPPPETPA